MKTLINVVYAFFLCLLSCSINAEQKDEQSVSVSIETPRLNDYHVHIMSPQLIALWKGMGISFSKQDHFYSNIDSILETTGANCISLISMAYVYSSGEFGGGSTSVNEKVKVENNFLSHAKASYPDRIKAYYGIDPLFDHAMNEIERCHKVLKLDGIKMHFNASQVYLTESEHLEKVNRIFQYASEHKIPVLLHFDNGHPKFGKTDVKILADSILGNLNYVNMQVAHFGTSGGFSPKTKEVLDTFMELFENNHPISKHRILFDISAVCLDNDADGVSQLKKKEFEDLVYYCRKLGFNRIVFGTDYPLYKSGEYLDVLRKELKLTEDEIIRLLEDK